MRIEHVKRTAVAMAPDELAKAQRKYGHKARVNSRRKNVDIIHFTTG